MSRSDNSPSAAAAAILAGMRRVINGFGTRVEQVLAQTDTTASSQQLVVSLVNDLGDTAGTCLVLDDFHEITDPECIALFDALADHLPPAVHLIVATRTEPQLSIPRRRIRGEVAELGLDELRLGSRAPVAALASTPRPAAQ